jgi:hypothetical protein
MSTLEARLKALQRMPKIPRVVRSGAKRASVVTLQRGVASLAGRLQKLGQAVQVQVALIGARGKRRELNVLVTPDGPRVLRRPTARPAVAFVMAEADWLDIASGRTPPALTYLTGRVRVVGDCQLARQIYRMLTRDSSGRIA